MALVHLACPEVLHTLVHPVYHMALVPPVYPKVLHILDHPVCHEALYGQDDLVVAYETLAQPNDAWNGPYTSLDCASGDCLPKFSNYDGSRGNGFYDNPAAY